MTGARAKFRTNLTMNTPLNSGMVMPGEWGEHERCWMAWPSAHLQWEEFDRVEQAYARVANAVAQFEPVTMVVNASGIACA